MAHLQQMRPDGGTPIGDAIVEVKQKLDATELRRMHILVVTDGETGWTFEPGDAGALAKLLSTASSMTATERAALTGKACTRVGEFGLDRFAAGVLAALEIPRALPSRGPAAWMAEAWKGQIRIY